MPAFPTFNLCKQTFWLIYRQKALHAGIPWPSVAKYAGATVLYFLSTDPLANNCPAIMAARFVRRNTRACQAVFKCGRDPDPRNVFGGYAIRQWCPQYGSPSTVRPPQ
jgi:hypothetical protein